MTGERPWPTHRPLRSHTLRPSHRRPGRGQIARRGDHARV